jgi:hypothetical protein
MHWEVRHLSPQEAWGVHLGVDGDEGPGQDLREQGRHEDGTQGGCGCHEHGQRHITVRDICRHIRGLHRVKNVVKRSDMYLKDTKKHRPFHPEAP